MRCLPLTLTLIAVAQQAPAADGPPWKANTPIVSVKRELYVKHVRPKVGAWVSVGYEGPGLERVETHTFMAKSDTPEKPKRRRSLDNGRTWTDFEPMPEIITHPQGVRVHWGGGTSLYDVATNVSVGIWLRQTHYKGVYHNQLFCRLSRDNGRTWGEAVQLRYEEGEEFDPANPFSAGFLDNNQAYPGNNTIRHSNGTIIHSIAAANIPKDAPDPNPGNVKAFAVGAGSRAIGSLCFIGTWSEEKAAYDWTAGRPVWVSRNVSSRGLMEPEVAELKDGRVLVIWRGSNDGLNRAKSPGRKWFSVSTDGGRILSPVDELKYDDGSRFYSPSSIHRMVRHSVSGKLYWIGNVCPHPTSGNSPRYPLIIAEVDEEKPALKKKTVTVIDDLQPGESPRLQLSNFSLLENRETHELEIYLTRLGADPDDFWASDAFKYTLTLVK